jgi:hypothetical protein
VTAPPRFAVVGHPNKGKSSIVATLAEDDSVRISPLPGTTTVARYYPMRLDGETLYELIDTPGFQRAREALAWLERHDRGAEARPAVLKEFLSAHREDRRFHDECELLTPIVEGAGILYVVDGAHPYGREYEAEMEVLRWSGRPRMALVNLIGSGDHVEEWRTALGQFFAIVRVFDAVHADFDKRIELLHAFGELDESWRAPLRRAAKALVDERLRRRRRAAAEIADLLCNVLACVERVPTESETPDPDEVHRASETLKRRIRNRERQAREAVEAIYQHAGMAREEAEASFLDADVFAATTFSVFGLSNRQLALTGAASGAIAAGGVDLLLGGASLGLAAAIGALIGGTGAWFGAAEVAKVRVLGQRLGGRDLVVGPVTAPNFPWVILGRAVLHHRMVAERNHARREKLIVDAAAGAHLADGIDTVRRRALASQFARLRTSLEPDAGTRRSLASEVEALLEEARATPAPAGDP